MKTIGLSLLLSLLPCFLAAQTPDFKQQKDSLLKVIANAWGEAKLEAWDDYVSLLYLHENTPEFLLEALANYKKEALIQKDYHHAAVCLDKVINTQSKYNRYDALRTQYEVDKHIAEKEKTRNYLFFAIAGCFLLTLALGIWIYLHHQIVQKNHFLYRQVQDLMQKEKEAEQQLFNVLEEELSRSMQLFRQLSERMQKDKLFIEPDLNRKKLANQLHTNEHYLADAIREATGETFSTYLANLRLQYALELLEENSGLPIDALAIDSGHGSYASFLRLFTKKYGITPSEYRKLATEKNLKKNLSID